jgi:hypothetical protein
MAFAGKKDAKTCTRMSTAKMNHHLILSAHGNNIYGSDLLQVRINSSFSLRQHHTVKEMFYSTTVMDLFQNRRYRIVPNLELRYF